MSSANFKLKRTAAASRGFLATAGFSCSLISPAVTSVIASWWHPASIDPAYIRDPASIGDPASIRTTDSDPPACIRDPASIKTLLTCHIRVINFFYI